MRILKIVVLLSLIQIPFLFANYAKDKMVVNKVLEEKLIKRALHTGMLDATVAINEYARIELIEGTPELVLEPEEVVNTFLNSLSVQLSGMLASEAIKYMVPFIAIADVDGVFFYELIEENHQLISKCLDKEAYIRNYPNNIQIQYFLNNHIRVYEKGILRYDGLYYDKESVVPTGFDYESEKIAATVTKVEERMNQYYQTWCDSNSNIRLALLQEDDWANASSDVTIYALVYQMGTKPIRIINNCGIGNVR